MRVYTRIVLDIKTSEVISREWVDVPESEWAYCKKQQSTVDRAYNARMAAIAERQQNIAEEFLGFWREYERPLQIEKTRASRELIPAQLRAAKGFYGMAARGIDPEEEAAAAQAEVAHGFAGATGEMTREIARYGLDPTSGKWADMMRQMTISKASGIAGARTAGKRYAKEESFRRLGLATGSI